MARAKTATPPTPTTYDLIGFRLQKIINSPKAQRDKAVVLSKLPEESDTDWDQVVSDISEVDNVTVGKLADGSIKVQWVVPFEG
ncbi:DUF1654 domain-containing protein [Pseudomonas monteilii]|uniref:DUF1654 domain-containing protein n=1 Tax=Pseudomonas monteilii TaxID=76759 RepID=UPI000378EA77|nr:DUF1654 domain-containing protein [Pseudomonas monteilii]AYN16711.1 DUF1654 domain-containing protein [Pseudomonas monteilii]